MRIGFIGGTGIEAKGLALRFASAGASVILGSRAKERALQTASQYNKLLGEPSISGLTNQEMLPLVELAFLTVPFDQATAAIDSCRDFFTTDQILVDVTVPVRFDQDGPEYIEQEAGSNAELIARRVPEGIHLVCAFKTIPARVLAELQTELRCDVFVCSDSEDARQRLIEVIRLIPTLRPLDAGPLRMARTLERMSVLAIRLNRTYKKIGARYYVQGI